jgi:lysophospholipase L1-like esterase
MLPHSLISLLLVTVSSLVDAEQIPLQQDTPKFPWIRKFASIGDSYAAGLGAGSSLDYLCSRYDLSYPHILHTKLLGNDSNRTHQFLACTGATTTMMLATQVPQLAKNLDLLTISGGGNDVGLTFILNDCIYQFVRPRYQVCVAQSTV